MYTDDIKFYENTEFLSHPKFNQIHKLSEHLDRVAKNIDKLLNNINISKESKRYAHFAALLHDIGKLQPVYQRLFNVGSQKELDDLIKWDESFKKRQHSIYSAWVLYKIVSDEYEVPFSQAVTIVASHHTRLVIPSGKDKKIDDEFYDNLKKFIKEPTKSLESVKDPISFQGLRLKNDNGKDTFEEFLNINIMFSALLQADRGSFNNKSDVPSFIDDSGNLLISFDTKNLLKDAPLSDLRTNFQNYVLGNVNLDNNLIVIEAPTGIGKTKLFLDIIKKYKTKKDRVIYFSPLLALNDDFEKKLHSIIDKSNEKNILVYSSVFTGTLNDKSDENYSYQSKDYFDLESLNYPFVITTTERLLITLFSNLTIDKLKLLSFANSILIIDEIQVIPAFLIGPLIKILYALSEKLNSKIIILSATIPYAIKSLMKYMQNSQIIGPKEDLKKEYLEKTKKMINYSELDYESIISFLSKERKNSKKILIMFNTRRKALEFVRCLKNNFKFYYITSGIRKCDREQIIEQIKYMNNILVVSTQTLEAGVDLDFQRIFRELAPLDSIVQVIGRLNRENNFKDAVLTIFKIKDLKNYWVPYQQHYVKRSCEFIRRGINNSVALYDNLENYYNTIYNENKLDENESNNFELGIKNLNFDECRNNVVKQLNDEYGDSIFIPITNEEYNNMRNEFLSKSKSEINKAYKKYAKFQAKLPGKIDKLDFMQYLDEDLAKQNIFVLKPDSREYDKQVGLDKNLDKIKSNNIDSRVF